MNNKVTKIHLYLMKYNKKYEVIDRIKPLGGRFLLMNNMFHATYEWH